MPTKQEIIDSFKAYHADSNLSYTDMTKLEEVLQAILSISFTGGGDASSANQLLQLTELEEINTKTPALVNGKIPVDIASLNVTVDNAQLEIANDTGNPVPVTSVGGLIYTSIGANATANIKNTSGVVYSLTCTNLNASTRYLLLFDSTGSTAGTPVGSYPVYGNGGFLEIGLNILGLVGLNFSTGITFGFSTTATTYTAGSAGDCILGVRYA